MKRSRSLVLITIIGMLLVLLSLPASAQSVNIDLGDPEGSLTDRVLQLVALISILSLAPSILIMVTSFIRIVVVLSLLRMAMGVQSSPPNTVIISLALFLTAFIMAPTFQVAYEAGIKPYMDQEMELSVAYDQSSKPVKEFMLSQVREDDLSLFIGMAQVEVPENPIDIQMHVLIPSFMISELRRAFEIGFLIFIPFLVIDMVVASVLMSMGMMMLPPIIISLPFKLIFFVLVDGWQLIAGSLVKSFGTLPPGG
jgi:flagellar biosynthesis protein FliP